MPQQVCAGQSIYTPQTLAVYDRLVPGFSNRWIWRCPTSRILELYNCRISDNHLDVGPGTGYFLDRCQFPSGQPRVALLDLNQHVLDFAARRLARYRPEIWLRNILEPLSLDGDAFDSVAINYLLHCLPGSMQAKSIALDHIKPLLTRGGCIFGSTILGRGVSCGWPARRVIRAYNRRGIFCNEHDDLATLKTVLATRFDNVQVKVTGCVARFSGMA